MSTMTEEEWDNMDKQYPSNSPDMDERWCMKNCTNGYVWKHVVGMINEDGCQCPRISCKRFWEHIHKESEETK